MLPNYKQGEKVLVFKSFSFKINDAIICKNPKTKRILLKRIVKIRDKKYFVQGDNKKESTDSRDFGFLERKDIIGKVILCF